MPRGLEAEEPAVNHNGELPNIQLPGAGNYLTYKYLVLVSYLMYNYLVMVSYLMYNYLGMVNYVMYNYLVVVS